MENMNKDNNLENNSNVIYGIPAIAMRGKTIFPNIITNIDVGRASSLSAINVAMNKDKLIFVVSQKDQSVIDAKVSDLYTVGTVCRMGTLSIVKPNSSYRLSLEGLYTARITSIEDNKDYFCFNVEKIATKMPEDLTNIEALFRLAKREFKETIDKLPNVNSESMKVAMSIDNYEAFVNVASFNVPLKNSEKQAILENVNVEEKYNLLLEFLQKG